MHAEADLVVARNHRVVGGSHSTGKGGSHVRLERNGILALRTGSGRAVWATEKATYGFPADARVGASGDVAIVDQTGNRLRHSATG